MTHNQYRAIALAKAIRQDAVHPEDLPEADWHLLLLAAGTNKVFAAPLLVANRVMDNARHHVGYFAETRGSSDLKFFPTDDVCGVRPERKSHAVRETSRRLNIAVFFS